MAEAMLMGKPVVATGYSGNMEFMNEDNSLLVDYKLVKLGEPIPPYEADYEWAEPSEDHAANLLRRLYDEPSFARELGLKAKIDAVGRLSVSEAGRRIAARLIEIEASRSKGDA
jgi:glycosyltransferase involved in cell wall biosynthesis